MGTYLGVGTCRYITYLINFSVAAFVWNINLFHSTSQVVLVEYMLHPTFMFHVLMLIAKQNELSRFMDHPKQTETSCFFCDFPHLVAQMVKPIIHPQHGQWVQMDQVYLLSAQNSPDSTCTPRTSRGTSRLTSLVTRVMQAVTSAPRFPLR